MGEVRKKKQEVGKAWGGKGMGWVKLSVEEASGMRGKRGESRLRREPGVEGVVDGGGRI